MLNNFPCANPVICRVPLDGFFDVDLKGTYVGYACGELTGTVDIFFQGNIIAVVTGRVLGDFVGLVNNVDFAGILDQSGTVSLSGEFGGKITASISGSICGQVSGYWDIHFRGILHGLFFGDVNGVPTNPDDPRRNFSAEDPDDPRGFGIPNFDLPGPGGGGNTPDNGGGTDPVVILYSNDPTSCTRICADLVEVTVNVIASFFTGYLTQAAANAAAMAYACERADTFCEDGVLPPFYQNTPQSCTIQCNGVAFTFTVPAESESSNISQADANERARLRACFMADLTCLPPPQGPPGQPRPPLRLTYANSIQRAHEECPNGGEFSYSVPSSRYFGPSVDAANRFAQSYADNHLVENRFCLDQTSLDWCVGTAGSKTLSLFGFVVPVSWSVAGLPDGFELQDLATNGQSMQVVGNPAIAGTYPVTFTITYVDPGIGRGYISTLVKTIPFNVGEITTPTLPNGTLDEPYFETLAGTGFGADVPWVVSSGNLPPGLPLGTDGVLQGTPTEEAAFHFTVQRGACEREFTITIGGACVNFDSLAWDAVVFEGFSGTGAAVGKTVNFTLTGSPGVGEASLGFIHGSFLFTGGPCDCKITITGTWSEGSETTQSAEAHCDITQDGNSVYSGANPPFGTWTQNQTIATFTLAAGIDSLIDITITGLANQGNGTQVGATVTLQLVFDNA